MMPPIAPVWPPANPPEEWVTHLSFPSPLCVPPPAPVPLADRAADLARRAQLAMGSLAPMYASHQALLMVEELAGMVAELAKGRGL